MMNQFITRALADRVRYLSSVSSFESVDSLHITSLARVITPRYVPAGEMLLKEDQHADDLSILVQGFAEVFKHSVDGWEGTIRLLGPGDICGEESVIAADSSFSIEAFDDLFLYCIEPDDLKRCMEANPDISLAFMRTLLGTIKHLGSILIEMGS
jgi:CRP-like cAMP-binding protein